MSKERVDLHITTVQEWLAVNGFVPPGSNFGALPEVLDVELRFAKQHFTADKLAALPPELAATISHNDLTHVEAQQIYKHLEQKDGNGSATNIFGIFHSHALKSWHDLLRSWERDNFHISHAASHLAKKVGVDVQVVTRKLQAAEKAMKTIDSRLIELQRASLSYDKAYSDEYKAWKKRQKEWELTGIRKLAPEDDVADVDPESLYDEVCTHLSDDPFILSMDYLFNFRKVPNLQTVRNDYPRTYRVLRSVSAIPQQAGDPRSTNEEDDTIDVIIRQDNVPRDLLLELQGLKALLKQKAAAIEAASSSSSSSSGSGGEEVSDAAVDQLGDVHAHVAAVEAVISKTKVLRAVLQSSTKKHASSITSDASADQLRLLRERAVKYRMFFDELRQNREDVGASMHRYADELAQLRESCVQLKDWLEAELSRLSGDDVSIVC